MNNAIQKLQGAINQASLKKEKGYVFQIATFKKAISAIKAFPELSPEEAIKKRFKNPYGILKKIKSNYKPLPFGNVHGFGPQMASNLMKKGINSIENLLKNKNIYNKLTKAQKLGLKFYENAKQPIPRKDIEVFEKQISKLSKDCETIIAGSYRRGNKQSGDIDVILLCKDDSVELFKKFIDKAIKKGILHKEHLSYGNKKWLGYGKTGNKFSRIDILFTTKKEYPFALLYFTGSGDFNERMRAYAKSQGYSLSEKGIKGVNRIFEDEKDIFQFFGLEYIKPEDRKFFPEINKAKKDTSRRKAMLASESFPKNLKNYYMSEKLDGIRALWNGTILYSRTGKEFSAPKWFTNKLPNMELDGELYIGPGKFEETQSVVMKKVPNSSEWRKVKYKIFNAPSNKPFSERYNNFKNMNHALTHTKITNQNQFNKFYENILAQKGEGVMLRKINSPYEEKRSKFLIKVKPKRNAEAIVVDVQKGKGKYVGKMGALVVKDLNTNIQFKIGSGFNDSHRSESWKKGNKITYIYRDKTAKGVPRFATFKARRLN